MYPVSSDKVKESDTFRGSGMGSYLRGLNYFSGLV